jgi:hypothetical protein
MHQHLAVVGLLNKVIEHLLGDFKVSDDAVFHRFDGHDVAGRASQHLLGIFADGFHLAGVFVNGYNGGLVDNNALSGCEDQCVGGAEINGQITRKHAEK